MWCVEKRSESWEIYKSGEKRNEDFKIKDQVYMLECDTNWECVIVAETVTRNNVI